jgi:hypothetical protein
MDWRLVICDHLSGTATTRQYVPQNTPIDTSGASLEERAVSQIRIGFPWLPFRESDVFQPGAHDAAKF